jgi:hypothetical protein
MKDMKDRQTTKPTSTEPAAACSSFKAQPFPEMAQQEVLHLAYIETETQSLTKRRSEAEKQKGTSSCAYVSNKTCWL